MNGLTKFLFLSIPLGTTICMQAWAGLLDLPDTSEVPEFEEETLLLDMDIPPVRDRDPDPEAGPRLNVKEFRLQGVVEFPNLDITREAIIKKVEEIRFDFMNEGELTDSGYTLDELGEISDLIADIEEETEGEHVGPLEVQKLVFLIREQRRRRGITLGMIETVADTITRYYRERGFILAKAYIPKQQVRDGVVTLTLLLGELGEVSVVNNKRVSSKQVSNVFKKDLFQPVTAWNIEEKLYLVNDIPGVSAQGFFQPGSQVGDTRLNINVLNEEGYSINLRQDNHGSETTGRLRTYGDIFLHNPLGYGDELQIGALYTIDPDNTVYGSARYSFPLFSSRLRGALGVSSNDFVFQTFSGNDNGEGLRFGTSVAGQSLVTDFNLNYKLKRSRKRNLFWGLNVSDINTNLEINTNETETSALNTTLSFSFDILNERKRSLHVGNISLVNSSAETDSAASPNTETTDVFFLTYDYSRLSFTKIPFLSATGRLVLKASGQLAGESVGNINQFALTGPTRARGYEVSTGFFDDAVFFAADWFFNLPGDEKNTLFGKELNRLFQPYLFIDFGYGVLHGIEEQAEDTLQGSLSDVGVGLNFNIGAFKSNLTFAVPISEDIGLDEEVPSNSIYFDMQYSF